MKSFTILKAIPLTKHHGYDGSGCIDKNKKKGTYSSQASA
jgi:hypothetical protein